MAERFRAVEDQHLVDSGPGRQQEQDERADAQLGECLGGHLLEQCLARTVVEWLGQALGQLGQVDDGAEVAGQPFFPGGEPQEAPEGDESPRAGSGRQRPAVALRAGLQVSQVPLVVPQQFPVDRATSGTLLLHC